MQKREIVKTRLRGANTAHICNHIQCGRRSKGMKRLAKFSHSEQIVFVKGR